MLRVDADVVEVLGVPGALDLLDEQHAPGARQLGDGRQPGAVGHLPPRKLAARALVDAGDDPEAERDRLHRFGLGAHDLQLALVHPDQAAEMRDELAFARLRFRVLDRLE